MRYKTELKIKMTAYNKLKIAILAIITSQNIHAITIERWSHMFEQLKAYL